MQWIYVAMFLTWEKSHMPSSEITQITVEIKKSCHSENWNHTNFANICKCLVASIYELWHTWQASCLSNGGCDTGKSCVCYLLNDRNQQKQIAPHKVRKLWKIAEITSEIMWLQNLIRFKALRWTSCWPLIRSVYSLLSTLLSLGW